MQGTSQFILAWTLAAAALAWAPVPAAGQPAVAAAAATATAASERNVYAFGGQVRPAAAVPGDFTAAGGKVVVDQPVGGDATLAGGSIDVRAAVRDDVRAVGGDVGIEGAIGGELLASGGNVTLAKQATVARGATVYAGSLVVDGRVEGELRATAGKVTINGEVRGNARLFADTIELGPAARISGALTYASAHPLDKAEGAVVEGAVTREPEAPAATRRGERGWEPAMRGPGPMGGVLSFLALLAAGAMFLLLLPRFGVAASRHVPAAPWSCLGIGFGTAVGLPVLAVLLFITLLGIPLGLAVFALYPVLLLAGFLVGVLFLGRRLAAAMGRPEPQAFGASLAFFAAALAITLLLGRVPLVGGACVALLALAGLGGCVLEMHRRRRGGGDVAAQAPASPSRPVPAL